MREVFLKTTNLGHKYLPDISFARTIAHLAGYKHLFRGCETIKEYLDLAAVSFSKDRLFTKHLPLGAFTKINSINSR